MRKLLLGAAMLLAACQSVNPQMQAATDSAIAAAKGGHDEGAPSAYQPKGWEVGQWAVYKTTQKDKPPAVMRMAVVGKDDSGIWVETDSQDYYHHTLSKVAYARMPQTADEAGDLIAKIVTKQDDQETQTIDMATNPMAGLMRSTYKHLTAQINAPKDVSASPKEDVSVAAGSFKQAAKYTASVTLAPGYTKNLTSWFHPAVPLSGAVKWVSEDGEYTSELLDYGDSGATSKLQ